MRPINVSFKRVKVSENVFDVLMFADEKVLRTFNSIYEHTFYIENSKFGKPVLAVPGFGSESAARIWSEYWMQTFENPDKSCQTCPTVRELLQKLDEA